MNGADKRNGQVGRLAATIMLQGTASDVGKSLIAAAICRILTQDGFRTAPFKSQNMSNNAYVTWDGKEIGQAQGMQADACGIPASTDMNPILLKPSGPMRSQVVLHGVPLRDYEARAYREQFLNAAEPIVREALTRLRTAYDVVVMEGAGSPAEINLKDRDIVNMRAAEWGDAPVLLVADIDRGGVFASIVGTLELLEPHERDRVAGFVINKFRGDVSLLQPGLDWLEQRTGKPVFGVIPYLEGLELEDEDSLSLDNRRRLSSEAVMPEADGARLDIAVLRLPHIANFMDIDPLHAEADVRIRYVASADTFGRPDAVIIPGSKHTVHDLQFLRESGLATALERYKEQGGFVAGICGGYEMMGRLICDPEGVESDRRETEGLGWFPFSTVFGRTKRTVRVSGFAELPGHAERYDVSGYEIHMGSIAAESPFLRPFRLTERRDTAFAASTDATAGIVDTSAAPARSATSATSAGSAAADTFATSATSAAAATSATSATLENVNDDGVLVEEGAASADGRVWGTFLHGVLQNDEFRRGWLNTVRQAQGLPALPAELRFRERREAAFDRLADHVRGHLNMALFYKLLGFVKEETADGPAVP